MHFRDFYTSIYNICLGFIKIEKQIGKEEVKTKFVKKTGSPRRSGFPRRSIPSLRRSRQWLEDRSQVRLGEQTFT